MNSINGGDDIKMYISKPNKPLRAIEAIYKNIEPYGNEFSIRNNEILSTTENDGESCFTFIAYGQFTVYRGTDGLLVHSGSSPSLIGVIEYFQPRNAYYALTDTPCSGIKINAGVACDLFTRNDLWRSVFEVQVYFTQILQMRDSQLVGVNSYLIIRNKLIELLQTPDEIRKKISVLIYIQMRTNLSKSVISKILSALRVGGYINMERGKLISIKHFPNKY